MAQGEQSRLCAPWDVAKQRILGGKTQEMQTQAALFRYFLALYNSTSNQPVFVLQDTRSGMEFSVRDGIYLDYMNVLSEQMKDGHRCTQTMRGGRRTA